MRKFFIVILCIIGLSWLGYTTHIFLQYNSLWMNMKLSNGLYVSQLIYYVGKNILTLIIFIIAYRLSDH